MNLGHRRRADQPHFPDDPIEEGLTSPGPLHPIRRDKKFFALIRRDHDVRSEAASQENVDRIEARPARISIRPVNTQPIESEGEGQPRSIGMSRL
jgi:hypothetical protein